MTQPMDCPGTGRSHVRLYRRVTLRWRSLPVYAPPDREGMICVATAVGEVVRQGKIATLPIR